MKASIGLSFAIMLFIPFLILLPDLFIYGTTAYKANAVIEHVTKEAEMQGGITPEVEALFNETMEDYGLADKNFTVNYSSTGAIQHRGRFEITLEGSYRFRTFNVLGTGLGSFNAPISAKDSGVSEVWVR